MSSTYEVSHLAGGQLQVATTPQYALGLPILVIGILSTCFFLYRLIQSRSLFPAWGLVLWCLPLLFAAGITLRTGSLILDKSANTALLHSPEFFWHRDSQLQLNSIRHAEIRSMRSTTYIALVLSSGDAVTFADSTQEGGKGRAVEAINRYLGADVR